MFHRLLVSFAPTRPIFIVSAGKVTALATMVDLPFDAADAKIAAAAAALKKAIVRRIPATSAQRVFIHHRVGAFIFPDPSPASVPLDQRLRRLHVMLNSDLIRNASLTIDSACRHF